MLRIVQPEGSVADVAYRLKSCSAGCIRVCHARILPVPGCFVTLRLFGIMCVCGIDNNKENYYECQSKTGVTPFTNKSHRCRCLWRAGRVLWDQPLVVPHRDPTC